MLLKHLPRSSTSTEFWSAYLRCLDTFSVTYKYHSTRPNHL